jgi:hypothetical protein
VEKAIKKVRDKKATENEDDDVIPGDVIKLLGEDGFRIVT